MSSNQQWIPNVASLAEHFHVVMIELWGHGRSPTPQSQAAYTAEGLVGAIDVVRDRLGVALWSVLGHSLGGAVALKYALARPARTSAVLFTNSRAALAKPDADDAALAADRLADLASPRELPHHPVHAKRYPAALKRRLMADADSTSPTALDRMIRQSWQFSSRDELHALQIPATLINGIRERRFQDDVAVLRLLNPHIGVIDLDGGHSINIEAATQFNAAVIHILSDETDAHQAPPR